MAKSLPPRGRKIEQYTCTFCICSRQEQKKDKVENDYLKATPHYIDILKSDHPQPYKINIINRQCKDQKELCKHRYILNISPIHNSNRRKLPVIYYEDVSAIFEDVSVIFEGNRKKICSKRPDSDSYCYIQNYFQHARLRVGVTKVQVSGYHTSTVSVIWENQDTFSFPEGIALQICKWKKRRRHVSVRQEEENNDVHCISLSNPSKSEVKATAQQIHDLTVLPHSKSEPAPVKVPPNSIELVAYPGRRKSNRGGQRSRHRPQNSQSPISRDEEGSSVPIQATDNVTDMPNRENTVTSTEPILGRVGLPVTTNLMSSIESEERLASRRRGMIQSRARTPTLRPPRYPEYADLEKRQASFTNWPQTTMQNPSNMAEQGFFYTGSQDLVRCFQCGIGMKDWSETDEPLFEHVRHSSECSFLLEHLGPELLAAYKINLIPAGAQPATQRGQTGSSMQAPAISTSQGNTPQSGSQGTGANTRTTTTATSNVRSPQYSTMDARIRSFNSDWPTNISQTPHQLAEAGFYFSGYGDVCRCFSCDGGLQRWDPQDDPWIEHARWFPECEYVRQTRGQDYIDLVQRAATQSSDEDSDHSSVVEPSLSGAMAGLSLNDSESLSSEAAKRVLEKGFSKKAVLLAIHELQAKGSRELTEQSILEILRGKQERGEALPTDTPPNEALADLDPERENDPNYLQEENEKLRRKIKCIQCNERDANMLFIPCTHHRMCEECAENIQTCPVCNLKIEKKVKTYMS